MQSAKPSLSPCQLRHETGMPTRWLTLKPGRLWGHMRGSGRQGGASRGVLGAAPASGSYAHYPSLGRFKLRRLFWQMGQGRCFRPPGQSFFFSFFHLTSRGTAAAVGHSGMGFIVTFNGGLLPENPSWESNSPSPGGWLEVRSTSARWQSLCSAPGASWVVLAGASTGPPAMPYKHDVTGRQKSCE